MAFFSGRVHELLRKIVLQKLRAPNSKQFDEFGFCSVCGEEVFFKANLWMISKEQKKDWDSPDEYLQFCLRESLFCDLCCSSYRQRSLAKVLVESVCSQLHSSLVECNRGNCFVEKKILLINSLGEYSFMQRLVESFGRVTVTCFNPDRDFGMDINGRVNADLMNLPFFDFEFDLVIHSDVLEHLADPNLALQESIRVLCFGGNTIFTIPFRDLDNSFCRFSFWENPPKPIHPEIFHGRGSGILSLLPKDSSFVEVHTYGRDFIEYLKLDRSKVELLRDKSKNWRGGSDSVIKITK
jgi:hypothetical protein